MAGRATLALFLMVGFYGMALAIAGGLLWIPYAMYAKANRVNARVVIGCLAGAGVILWSILPRRDKFVAPGPRLDERRHPKLFEEIRRIAEATEQPVPAEVYLIPDVNAFVSQRGGFMGVGGRRVMAVGLPMMQALKTSELRGVLCHEFGHYHGGDVKLGPWIYKTHEALFRTLENLGESGSILRYPFVGYAKLFLRVSHAISRRQEFAADELGVNIVGKEAFAAGLRVTHGVGAAYRPYLDTELFPILNAGFRPPVADGFRRFLADREVSRKVEEIVRDEMRSPERDPYLTHPPLADRLAAVESLDAGAPSIHAGPDDARSAVSLLGDLDAVELELLVWMTGAEKIRTLPTLGWSQVGEKVSLPAWSGQAKEHAAAIAGLKVADFPTIAFKLAEIGKKIIKEGTPEKAELENAAASVLGCALGTALHRAGWRLEIEPGAPVRLHKGDVAVEVFNVLPRLAQGKMTSEAWRSTCERGGIGPLSL
jgi:Zn-dependent protease with chaperone function